MINRNNKEDTPTSKELITIELLKLHAEHFDRVKLDSFINMFIYINERLHSGKKPKIKLSYEEDFEEGITVKCG